MAELPRLTSRVRILLPLSVYFRGPNPENEGPLIGRAAARAPLHTESQWKKQHLVRELLGCRRFGDYPEIVDGLANRKVQLMTVDHAAERQTRVLPSVCFYE